MFFNKGVELKVTWEDRDLDIKAYNLGKNKDVVEEAKK